MGYRQGSDTIRVAIGKDSSRCSGAEPVGKGARRGGGQRVRSVAVGGGLQVLVA